MQDTSAPAARPSIPAQAAMFAACALASVGNYYVYDSIGPVAEMLSTQLGFDDSQIGALNAVYSLPNIFMVLIGGVLCDRFNARSVMLLSTVLCFAGAVLTAAYGSFYPMVAGRLLFGLGAETMIVAVTVAFAQWFVGRHFALFFALNVSMSRIGSYLADRSPTFADSLYDQGWQPPLWLAAGFGAVCFLGGLAYWLVDRREAPRGTLAIAPPADHIDWGNLLRFRAAYWYVVGLCVTFYAVIFAFRSTFSIKYFQQAHGLTLEAASTLNSYVFLAAVFATPAFGILVDRVGRHALLMLLGSAMLPASFLFLGAGSNELWLSTVLLGAAFSLVPAVLWPAVARYVEPEQLGTAYGLMTMMQSVGVMLANLLAGHLNTASGASAENPAGYAPMIWFFGLTSLAGFVFTLLLWRQERLRLRVASP